MKATSPDCEALLFKPSSGIREHHLRLLEQSGISKQIARQHGITSSQAGSSYLIPLLDINGNRIGTQVRIYGNHYQDRRGRTRRFAVFGTDNNCNPRTHFPKLQKKTWKDIAQNPYEAIYITEGPKKAIKMCEEGYPCLGLIGSSQGLDKNNRLSAELQEITWTNRHVYIVFDNDKYQNKQIREDEARLKEALEKKGARVHIVDLAIDSSAKGVDDFLAGAKYQKNLFTASLALAQQQQI